MRASAQARFLALERLEGREELALAEPAGATTIPKPDELSWWDWAVFLLQTAAEIEHALMAQYLYAAYSLADGDFIGTHVPPDAAARTAWTSSSPAAALTT